MAQRPQVWDLDPESAVCDESCGCDCDCTQYCTELVESVPRLFSESRIDLQVIELGGQALYFDNVLELEEYLKKPVLSTKPVSRVFLVPQSHSFSRLSITFEALQIVCLHLSIYPQFIDVLRAFGEKVEATEDSYHAFNARSNLLHSTTETSYIVKRVEKNDRIRDDPLDQWSFRQSGFYQQVQTDSNSSVIVINPSRAFFIRLKKLNELGKLKTAWDVQTLLLSQSMRQWKLYQSELEQRVTAAKQNAQLAEVKHPAIHISVDSGNDLKFEDVQDLHALQDYSIKLCQHININIDVLKLVEANEDDQHVSTSTIPALTRTMDAQLKRAKVTLKRIEGSLDLAKSLLDFRSLDSANCFLQRLEDNSAVMNEMTQASQKEGQAIVELGRKASRDTDILKIITFVGLVYLPASFCASLLEMGYIDITSLRGRVSVAFHPGFYAFLVITAVLWLLTFGAYASWSVWSRKRSASELRRQRDHREYNEKV